MGKILLLLLVALGIGLWVEDSRVVILDFVSPATQPAYRWMTNQELKQIVGDLETHIVSRGGLPGTGDDFQAWMRERYRDDKFHTDAWGTPYRLRLQARTFQVVSAGTDATFGTEDDLTVEGSRDGSP